MDGVLGTFYIILTRWFLMRNSQEQIMRILQADRNNGKRRGAVHRCGTADAEWIFQTADSHWECTVYCHSLYCKSGATAIANRNYFENLATTHDTKVSSHFVVGLDGEVVQCIPTSEMSYATNSRNVDTLSIECCHPDETGKFNEATYDSAVKLSAWLCVRFGLTSENVMIRHYDVTGKTVRNIMWRIRMHGYRWNRILRRRLMLIMVCRMFSKTKIQHSTKNLPWNPQRSIVL